MKQNERTRGFSGRPHSGQILYQSCHFYAYIGRYGDFIFFAYLLVLVAFQFYAEI